MESILGPRGRVTITGRPLLPAFPALRLGAPDKKLAFPPYSILLTHLLPQDTVIFFSFYSSPTQHHGLNSESQEQGSVVAWPKTPKSETTYLLKRWRKPKCHGSPTRGTAVSSR